MKIKVGNKRLVLSKSDFVASGGEASVYAKGSTAYKIYSNKKQTLPSKKMTELSVLTHPGIIKPLDLIYDGNKVIGYSMRYIPSTWTLCQLFTKAFRERHKIKNDRILDLVKKIREVVQHCHEKGILIVDLNEMNVLTDKKFKEPYFLDVDSYQTPSFPATALMESIRDRHNKKFSEGTDWFAFAIISFEMFIGIHPYRGKHNNYKGLDERMKRNLSVLNKDVSVPPICQSLKVIPKAYLDWYTAVLEKGERTAPPADFVAPAIIIPIVKKRIGKGRVSRTTLDDLPQDINEFLFHGGTYYYLTDNSIVGQRTVNGDFKDGHMAWSNKPFVVALRDSKVVITDGETGNVTKTPQSGEDMAWGNGTVLVKNEGKLVELGILPNGNPYPLRIHNVLPKATKCFHGCVVQDMFGTCQVSLFPKKNTCWHYNVTELKGYRIIDAKFQANNEGTVGVFCAIGYDGKKYDRVTMTATATDTQVMVDKDVAERDVNFALLDSGTCVLALGDQKARVFKARIGSTSSMEVDDDWGSILWAAGDKLVASEGKSMEHLSLSKGN